MKISVLMANFNHAQFLETCCHALSNQTYKNWELILVDDGSTDHSPALIDLLVAREPRIKPLILPKNHGALAALRFGLPLLEGDLFFGIAADDYLLDANFFESAVREMHDRPGASGVFGRCKVIDMVDGRELWTMGTAPSEGLNTAASALNAFFENRLFVPGASAIWRSRLVHEAGFFDPQLGPQSDFYLNHALAASGDGVVFVPNLVTAVRASSDSFSACVTTDEFFLRHARVEAKLRALPVGASVSDASIRNWRWCVINARLAVTHQRPFYNKVRELADSAPAFVKVNFPKGFVELIDMVASRSAILSAELEDAVLNAASIFNKISGPIEGGPF